MVVNWKIASGLACAASATSLAALRPDNAATAPFLRPPTAFCEAPVEIPLEPPPPTAVLVSSFRRWLERQGADVTALNFKRAHSAAPQFGVFANESTSRRTARGIWGSLRVSLGFRSGLATLATFPVSMALTAESVVKAGNECPQAAALAELRELGVTDDRSLVMLHLLIERSVGRSLFLSFFFYK
jgi:hypothetical protein